jgi:N-acetylglucosamine-6-phosphate deacetylase
MQQIRKPISMTLYEQMIAKGFDQEQVWQYEGAMYMLATQMYTFLNEYEEYHKSFGVKPHIATEVTRCHDSFKKYIQTMSFRIQDDQTLNFFRDCDHFDPVVRKFADLKELVPYDKNKKNERS